MLAFAKFRGREDGYIFSETTYVCVYLRTKFPVSSIILQSFRNGRFYSLSVTSKQTPRRATQVRVKT